MNLALASYHLRLTLKGENLPVKDSWIQGGKADPYIVIRKGHGTIFETKSSCCFRQGVKTYQFMAPTDGEYMGEANTATWVYNGKSHYQKNTLNPEWKQVVVPLDKLCDDCDPTKQIVIDIWDYDFECPHDDFMGFVMVSIFDLFVSRLQNQPIPLKPGREGHTWGGHLIVKDIELCPRDEMLPVDKISSNTILHYICAKGDIDKIRLLLGQPNLVHEKASYSRATPLHVAAATRRDEAAYREIIKLLLDFNADPFEANSAAMTPLTLLAKTIDSASTAIMTIQKMAEDTSKRAVRKLTKIDPRRVRR